MANVDIDDLRGEGPQGWADQFELTKKSAATLRWVWRELAGAEGHRRVKYMAAWLLPNTVFKLMPFLALGQLMSAVESGSMERALWSVLGIGVALVSMEVTGNRLRYHREWAFDSYVVQIDKRLSELYFNHGIGQFLEEGSKLSASNVEKARGRVWSVIDLMMFEGISALMDIGIAFALVWVLSWRSGLVLAGLFLVHICFSVYMNLRIMRDGVEVDRRFRAHNRYRSDRWDLYRRVLMAGRAREEVQFMAEWMDEIAMEDNRLWIWFSNRVSVRGCVVTIIFTLCVGWEAYRALQGELAFASVVPLFSWSLSLFMNLWRLGHMERQLNWNLPSVQSMVDALLIQTNVPVKTDALEVLPNGPLKIELRGLGHTYPAGETGGAPTPVLRDLNLTIPAGSKVGLVGATGSGKSTLGKLLLRFMDPTSGAVLVNGHDLRDLDLDGYRRVVGDIPQHPEVLDGSLRDNVLYSVPMQDRGSYTDEDVWRVLDLVQLNDKARFTDGLDTKLGKNGMKLSGGQRQRLAIASAIVQHLRMVVIDEATSSLDAKTERRVQQGIEAMLGAETTAIVIAHRLPTLRFCDQIVVLRPVSDLEPAEPQVEYVASSLEDAHRNSPTFRAFADELNMSF